MILTLCVDKQPKSNPSSEIKTCAINIGNRLCSKDGVYDELIITLNNLNQLEGIIKRRCSIDRFNVVTKLQHEYIQTLDIPEITLFEGTNYVYLQEFNYLNMKIEYLTNVEMNKHFAKTEEFNSSLVLTAQEFNLKLLKKLDGEEFTHANIVLKLNDDTSEALIDADKINMRGKTFDLTVDEMAIESTNFSVSKEGKIRAKAGKISGFDIDNNKFYIEYAPEEQIFTVEDYQKVQAYILGVGTLTPEEFERYDINHDGIINSLDLFKIHKNIYYSKSATFQIDSSSFDRFILMTYDGIEKVKIGTNSVELPSLTIGKGEDFSIRKSNGYPLFYVQNHENAAYFSIDADDFMHCAFSSSYNSSTTIDVDFKTGDIISYGNIRCNSLTQTSKKKYKKNFEKLENALDIIKNIDVYKYNMKTDKDDDKKHIGFVIGDKFNYSKEVTSKDNNGVDIYSFVSVCCKAIQELKEQHEKEIKNQQKQIKQLQKRIKRLESEK